MEPKPEERLVIGSIDKFLRWMGWTIAERKNGHEPQWHHKEYGTVGQVAAVEAARRDWAKDREKVKELESKRN